MFVNALDDVLTECRKFPGPMWELGNNFVRAAIGSRGQVKRLRACPRLLNGARRFDILRLAAKRVAQSCANASSLSLSIFCSGVHFELSQEREELS